MYYKLFLYMLGFCVQIFPCAFFCIYPFYDDFRITRWKGLGLIAALMVASSVCFAWTYTMSPVSGRYDYLAADLVFYMTLFLLLAAYVYVIRASFRYKLFVFLVVMNYGFLITNIVSFASNQIRPPKEEYIYHPLWICLYAAANAVMFVPVRLVLDRIKWAFRLDIDKKLWLWVISIPLSFIAVLSIFYEIPSKAHISSRAILNVFAYAVQALMLFFVYWIIRIIEIERKRAEQSMRLKAMVANYQSMNENANEIRKIRHEVNHHFSAISLFLLNQDYKGASEYLSRVLASMPDISMAEYTPHMLLNAMLTEYRKKASSEGIAVEYEISVPGPIGIGDEDLCQFLSNMLDNAIEGAMGLGRDGRRLRLKIRQNGNFLSFVCENSFGSGSIRYVNGRLASSKQASPSGASSHGYGISIMESIAAKYNGIFQASAEGGVFCARANLCMNERQK